MKTRLLFAASALALATHALPAQVREREADRRRGEEMTRAYALGFGADADRPMIGVSTGTSGKRDTLGLLITDVVPDGPAAKAGIEEGDRIQSVNGVNLRLSEADAGESDMEGVALRRLTRELAKHNAGDEVELRLYREGQSRTVRLKTVEAEDLQPARSTWTSRSREDWDERATLGIGFGITGTRRDTSGILISSVTDDGPADKARIEEGDRIAAINGVDLRVPREDAGDHSIASTRIRRLSREMEKVKAGDEVELRLYRSGQTRTVRVKSVAQKDLPRGSGAGFFFNGGGVLPMIQGLRGATSVMPDIRILPRINGGNGVYFHDGREGDVRMRVSPEIERRMEDAMSRLRDTRIRVRPRGWTEAEPADAAMPAFKAAPVLPRKRVAATT
jgi:endonuclease YncB( thermonuclease family)